MTIREGGCLCGEVRIEATGYPLLQAICHCRQCQKNCGGSPASIVMYPSNSVALKKGELRYFDTPADSGNHVSRGFCTQCGTPIMSSLSSTNDFTIVKLGAFDDPSFFEPGSVFWTSEKNEWARDPEGVPCFEGNPPA